jgi:hypothetical protein
MTLSQTHVMGFEAKLYRNTGTVASPTWNEIANCRDLSLADSMTDVDVSARDGSGFAMSDVGLQTLELTCQMNADYGDADFVALQQAYYARTPIHFAVASGAIAAAGTQYVRFAGIITGFARSEALDDASRFDVTIKVTRASEGGTLVLPSWVTVTTTSTP